MYYYQTTPF